MEPLHLLLWRTLTPTQTDRIRWHLFPELRISERIGPISADVQVDDGEDGIIPDVIRVMDLQQEQLARSLGEGHRVIHGVAGSGKTMILAYRCIHLAQETNRPILVLCYNVSLASMLRQKLDAEGMSHRVEIRNFHKWCSDILWRYRVPKPSPNEFQGSAYVEELVQRVIQGVEQGRIPAGAYGAVLIDEGHDFKPEWLKLVAQMVNPETNALLVLYDDAQSIYEHQQQRRFSFASVGIQARGRTTILKLNYRNTQEILAIASEFAKALMTPDRSETALSDDDRPQWVQPQTGGRHGPLPQLIRLPNFSQEVDFLSQQAQRFKMQGTNWNDIAIIYRSKFMAKRIVERFNQSGIPVEWLNQDSHSRDYHPNQDSIKLVTMHSSKGLEFPVVLIPGIGFMPNLNHAPEGEARLLYVAMTRAMDQLVMTCDRSSEFVRRIEGAIGQSR